MMKFLFFCLTIASAAAQVPAPVPATPAPAPLPSTPPATTAADTLEVTLIPGKLAQGEQGTLSIRALNGRRLESYPATIEVEGLNIQYTGATRVPYSSANGRMMYAMELQYIIEALEPGTYTIPGQVFSIDGKSYTSKEVKVVVSEGPAVDETLQPQAQLAVGKTEMWEGEEVQVTVSVLMHRAIQITSTPFPVIKTDGVAVSRFDRNARIDQAEINGELWNAWMMPSSMVALKPGDITLGPAEVKLEVHMPASAQRDPFGSFPSVRRTLKVKTNTVPVKVKALPVEGKPEGFTGAVGNFQLIARTDTPVSSPQPVQLGDPIGFELTVMGMGNFDAVAPPALEKPDGLRAYKPKVSIENRGLGTEPGQKGFTQILFVEKTGPVSVVFQLPYFDPVTGKYATAKSRPIELIVTGNPEAVAAAASVTAAETRDFSGISEAAVPGEDLRDILPHAVDGGRWYSLTTATIPVHPLLLHGVPAVLLALILGSGTVRRLRALALARRPPPYAPRECAVIARDLHRGPLSRLQFYSFVSEYAGAWEYWKKSPLPQDEALGQVLAARDRWLYAANAEAAAAPVPGGEQMQAASILTSRLSA